MDAAPLVQPLRTTSRQTRRLLWAGLLSSFCLIALYLLHPGIVARTNHRATDMVMALAQVRAVSNAVIIVDIDDASLARYGQWPWPRSRIAQLLDAIHATGAASVGLDFILAEPDRFSPNVADNDLVLASALKRGPFVLGYEFLFKESNSNPSTCNLHPPGTIWVSASSQEYQWSDLFTAQGTVCNLPLFANATTHSGFLNAAPDDDGILRRIPMVIRLHEHIYPSLTLAMLMKLQGTSQIVVKKNLLGGLDLVIGTTTIPVDSHGNLLIPYVFPAASIHRISAGEFLDATSPKDNLRGKQAVVGLSAAGMEHILPTPSGPALSHAELHSIVLNGLLSGHLSIRTESYRYWETLVGLSMALLAALAIAKLPLLPSLTVNVVLLACSTGSAVLLFRNWGLLVSPLLPSILLGTNYILLVMIKTWKTELDARQYAENALSLLKSSERNLNSIVKTIPDIVYRLDAEGRIIFISPAIAKYTTSADSILGRCISDFVPPDQLSHVCYNIMERRTGARATTNLELQLRFSENTGDAPQETRFFSISAEGLYEGESPGQRTFIGTQGILRDITERKKLEEQLIAAQKLEVIGSLAAGVAHDLNNILAGLVSYPGLLLMELPADSPLREKIALIQDSGKSAAAIVQDLLTLGRRGARPAQVLDLNVVVADYLASIEGVTTLKHHPNVTIDRHLSQTPLLIKGSKVHIAKMLMNLLINAAEAMPAGGTISITTSNKFIDTPLSLYEEIPPGAYACICIADEGIGIAAEDQRKIFEPFYSKKLMQRSGSGLGMTVIWVTVKDHGGFVDLQSGEGEGTKIELYFPVTDAQNELPTSHLVLEDFVGTEHVLIIDDTPVQLHIAEKMLSKLGYNVTTAISGEAALKYVRSHGVDLLVLDVIMPGGMDGLATYEQILAIRPGQKAIITSGFSEPEKVAKLQLLGAGAYVQKPYTLEQLGQAVRTELDTATRT